MRVSKQSYGVLRNWEKMVCSLSTRKMVGARWQLSLHRLRILPPIKRNFPQTLIFSLRGEWPRHFADLPYG